MKLSHITAFVATATILMTSCGKSNVNNHKTATINKEIKVPQFNADSAYHFIERQVAFGPRVPNSDAHKECALYLESELKRFGADVIVQQGEVKAFDNTNLSIKNIIGQYQPQKRNRLLLFAHWDSRPFADHDSDPSRRNTPISGANDGASGVGVLLEIARNLQSTPTDMGIDIIFFDAEDYGTPDHIQTNYKADTWCLGTQFWGKNPHVKGYEARYGILLDMVGAPDATFFREGYSMQFAPKLVKQIWESAAQLGYSANFIYSDGGTITDDHVYVHKHRGIPCVDIIQYDMISETGFGNYWHTHNDTMENVSTQTLKAVGETVMTVIYNELQ